MKRVLISFFMLLTVLFLNVYTCYYEVKAINVGDYLDLYDGLKSVLEIIGADEDIAPEILRDATYACVFQGMGIIPKYGAIAELEWMRKGWAKALNRIYGGNDKTADNLTQEDYNKIGQYITNNITINDNGDISINSNMHEFVMGFSEELEPSYGYTYTLAEISQRMSYAEVYDALEDLIPQASDVLGKIYVVSLAGMNTRVWSIEPQLLASDRLFVKIGTVKTLNGYKYSSGPFMSMNDLSTYPLYTGYEYNSTSKSFESVNSQLSSLNFNVLLENLNNNISVGSSQSNFLVSNHSRIPVRVFSQIPSVSDYMYQPYYYNNEVWTDFSTSSGDYTFSPSNINTVTYGDVTSYVDNSNTENGYPPSVSDINVYIENKDEENKDTSSGGGSGSGGDDSGGSGGGIGSVGDIFGWLKQLGSVIASLIKGIGEFVTEVVTGLVAAITDLLGGIGDLITSITETLPTTFMNWFGTLFEWMPAEWKALLSASLVFMVLWGIIKLIRG